MSDHSANYICPSVFSRTGFVERQLTAAEIMTALDLHSRHHKGRRELPPDIIWFMGTTVRDRHVCFDEPLGEQWWGVGQTREVVGRINRPPKGRHGPKDSVELS